MAVVLVVTISRFDDFPFTDKYFLKNQVLDLEGLLNHLLRPSLKIRTNNLGFKIVSKHFFCNFFKYCTEINLLINYLKTIKSYKL